ncbi:WD40-repeat-containing domain protein [Schizophyllum amplum]|uniref:WD40-repeat-containing domain protein n=1 Tax=Schizophyllum amplum TaxID=97359 RepID=A0A550CT70_9AGAR|nr:WD40-repeat-containing domain protein [Auriculariopsis ampla]
MNLARHSISSISPIRVFDARFDPACEIFTAATPAGFAVYRTCPLELVRKRELTGGTLSMVVPLHTSSLLFLVGGGRSPLYPPNKVIFWDDILGTEVAELEFRERVRGVACRRGWLVVALRRRVVIFQLSVDEPQVRRHAEYDTCENLRGLAALATAPHSTLLAIPGRQMGHVQLIHLPPCAPPPPTPNRPAPPLKPPPAPNKRPVPMIIAHDSALTTLTVTLSGRLLATTSSRGTLVRVWDAYSGNKTRELRRGTDKADIYGVAFRPDERELCVWSDKGTVHIFALGANAANRQSSLSQLSQYLSLPKYLSSEWSYAQYRIPTQSAHISISSAGKQEGERVDEERCVVGWIEAESTAPLPSRPQSPGERAQNRRSSVSSTAAGREFQLVALTYTGGWYRLVLPKIVSLSGAGPGLASPPGRSTSMAGSPPRQHARSTSGSSNMSRPDKGKGKERDKEKETTDCTLVEFRRYGRWDGWA